MKNDKAKRLLITFSVTAGLFIAVLVAFGIIIAGHEVTDASEAVVTIDNLVINNGKAELTWNCDNAKVTSYRIKKTESQGNAEAIPVAFYHKYYQDTLESGKTYTYTVCAVNTITDGISSPSNEIAISFDASAEIIPLEKQKPIMNALSDGKLTWEPLKNTAYTTYALYKRQDESCDWDIEEILTPLTTKYQGESGCEYKLIVRCIIGDTIIRSQESEIVEVI